MHEQLVQATKKAILSGRLRPGDAFPSVRTLAAGLKIHANTAQRAVSILKQEGLLDIQPGIGTVVAVRAPSARAERTRMIRGEIEPILVEAMHMGATLDEFQQLIASEWQRLAPDAKQEV